MIKWVHAFFNAIVFLTRVPAPPGICFGREALNRSAMFFPLVGGLIGGVTAACFWVAHWVWPIHIAVAVAMACSILLTGAFHEDGLVDVCDGFGGGWERSEILMIMQDSRVGSFGVVGLVMVLGLKWMSLAAMNPSQIAISLIVAHTLSRWAATLVMGFGLSAPHRVQAKPKPMARQLGWIGMAGASMLGLASTLLLSLTTIPWVIGVVLLVAWGLYRYYVRRIGGFTGDGLGAIQQISEVGVYLMLLGVWTWPVT